ALADIDNDGKAEILECYYDPQSYKGILHAFKADWSEPKGFPVHVDSLPPVSGGISVAELNPSYSGPEIVLVAANPNIGTYLGVTPASGGDFLRPLTKVSTACASIPPVIANLDGDGKPDIAIMIRESLIICDHEGVPGIRKLARKHFEWWPGSGHAVAGDIDEDGNQELIFGSFNGLIHAVDETGTTVPGFPVSLSLKADWAGNAIFSSPLLSDVDGNGTMNLILPTYARYLYAWDMESAAKTEWPSVRHDPWNTGYQGFVVPEAWILSSGRDSQKPGLNLYAPYPNPFRDNIVISYSLPNESYVWLKIYDVSGRRIKEIVAGKETAGPHDLILDTKDMAAGVYFLRLDHPQGQFTKKITKIR
ncbi:MAG: T9SS type A sorting domain-containing protein, partial [Candidatus Hydrothermia bacterium]